MDAEETSGEDLCEWLIDQIEKTTTIERLTFIAEVIADDKSTNSEYLCEDCVRKLRLAWSSKMNELKSDTVGSLPSVQGESTDK